MRKINVCVVSGRVCHGHAVSSMAVSLIGDKRGVIVMADACFYCTIYDLVSCNNFKAEKINIINLHLPELSLKQNFR